MKVIMLQQYTDEEYGVTFEAGWSVEFTDPHGQRLIDHGIAKSAPKNTRPTRSAVLLTTCFPASEPTPEKTEKRKKRADDHDDDPEQ